MSGTATGTGRAVMGYLLAEPSPSDVEEFNAVTVSPGLSGFIAMFILAVGVVLLVVDMTRRVRRVQAKDRVENRMAEAERAEEREARAAEEQTGQGQAGSAGATAGDLAPSPDDDGPDGDGPDADGPGSHESGTGDSAPGSRREDPPLS